MLEKRKCREPNFDAYIACEQKQKPKLNLFLIASFLLALVLIHQLQREPPAAVRAAKTLHTAGMRPLSVVRAIPSQLVLAPRAVTPEARWRHQAIPPLVVHDLCRPMGVFGRRNNDHRFGRVVGGGAASGAGLDPREGRRAGRARPQDWPCWTPECEAASHGACGGFLCVRENGRVHRFVDRWDRGRSRKGSGGSSSGRGGGGTLLVLAAKAAKKLLQTPSESHC